MPADQNSQNPQHTAEQLRAAAKEHAHQVSGAVSAQPPRELIGRPGTRAPVPQAAPPATVPATALPALHQQLNDDGFGLVATPPQSRLSGIQGEILKYRKGEYSINRGAVRIPVGTLMIVRRAEEKLCLFIDQKLQQVIERVEGMPFPARETLGHLDKAAWSVGPGGQPSDPWQPSVYLTLCEVDTMIDYTFVSSTVGGTRAVRNLCQLISYKRRMLGRSDVFARVRLDVARQNHKEYGTIIDPVFPIIDLVDKNTLQPIPEPTLAKELDDANPF